MDTSRDDVGIAIRSAFLKKGTKQRFSLLVLVITSFLLIFLETIQTKPLNSVRSIVKDLIYRTALVSNYPLKSFSNLYNFVGDHFNLYKNYEEVVKENYELKNNISKNNFLELENTQLRKLIEEQPTYKTERVSARVMLDNSSPYLNSFVINMGSNKNIKNGMAVLSGENFIGRIVDVNYFSARVLLATDLNSKIPVITEPSGSHAILAGHGKNNPTLEYFPKKNIIKNGDKVYTSGKEGIFSPGIPVGEVKIEDELINVLLLTDLSQITFVNVDLGYKNNK